MPRIPKPRGHVSEDVRLAARLVARDEAALEVVYEHHSRACLALARRLLVDPALAEDVLQEVFLQLWQRPESYQPDRGSLRTWLLTVCHHKAVDRIRLHRRQTGKDTSDEVLEFVASAVQAPDQQAVASDTSRRVVAALGELPEAQRQVVALAYYGGYSQSEIAKLTGIALGTVKSRTLTAMRRLGVLLDDIGRVEVQP